MVSKPDLDSILENKIDLSQYIGLRKARYRKLNLAKQQQTALLFGLWKDNTSTDSVDYQFFVQKGEFGFLKVKDADRKKPTAIKPNGGYDYRWINQNLLYYRKQAATGFVADNSAANQYVLMRIEKLTKKELIVTLSTRTFNKAGLDYIKRENDFNLYFSSNQRRFERIKVIEKKS